MAIKGFNFRMTSAYVTDVSPDTYVLCATDGTSADDYPTTRNGVTFGWTDRGGTTVYPRGRNRDNTANPKLAGVHFSESDGVTRLKNFQIDLTGAIKVRLAMGDISFGHSDYCAVRDSAGEKFNVSDASVAAGSFVDAAGTEYTAADWLTTNAQSAQYTFSDYVLLRLGRDSDRNGYIAHCAIETIAAGNPWYAYAQM